MQPNDQTSVRRSVSLPRACSGLMNSGVPTISPGVEVSMTTVGERDMSPAIGRLIALASPKSRTLTLPSGVILMFAGFRSRWITPFSCANSSASAIWAPMRSASAIDSGPPTSRWASVSPSTSSMTMYRVEPSSSAP